jgi:hypothetical protein
MAALLVTVVKATAQDVPKYLDDELVALVQVYQGLGGGWQQ